MKLQIIHNNKINYNRWDECIGSSINANIYSLSWYLDIVSEGWDALVMGDYDYIMPLTHKKKFGIAYLIQPNFTQQLGIFSGSNISNDTYKAFLNTVSEKYRYVNINLNKFNRIETDDFNLKKNTNYELELIYNYTLLSGKYSLNTKRNLEKAKKYGQKVVYGKCSVNEFVIFLKNNIGFKVQTLNEEKYNIIKKILGFCLHHDTGEIVSVYSSNNTMLSTAFLVNSNNRVVYLFAASSPEGKEKRSMFLLIDDFIRKKSGRNLILDFEGSNIESLARFYGSFGAVKSEYLTIKKNNLPLPFRYFKK